MLSRTTAALSLAAALIICAGIVHVTNPSWTASTADYSYSLISGVIESTRGMAAGVGGDPTAKWVKVDGGTAAHLNLDKIPKILHQVRSE